MKLLIVDTLRDLWRFWSVRFDIVMYSVMGYFISNPAELLRLVDFLPDGWRPVAGVLLPALLFAARSGAGVAGRNKVAGEVRAESA